MNKLSGVEFTEWLQRNHDKFLTYTPDEIADLAIACGFSRSDVAMFVTQLKFQEAR